MAQTVPVIDLFAGPGGLGEGFAHSEGPVKFDVRLSCEVDPVACRTLRLRKFFLLAGKESKAKADYYEAIRTQRDPDRWLADRHPDLWAEANARVLQVKLGDNERRVEVHDRIESVVGRSGDFVLIGGPPCQAYSLMGRSRLLGVGGLSDATQSERIRRERERRFFADHRHRLYREYLEIIAVHRPAVFVMENVKGLASAKSAAGAAATSMARQILADLRDPVKALENSLHPEIRKRVRDELRYRLVSLSGERLNDDPQGNMFSEPTSAHDFILRSERYGVPQARHRVIIIGVREGFEPEIMPLDISKAISARRVLRQLPSLRSSLSKGEAGPHQWAQTVRDEVTARIAHLNRYGLKAYLDKLERRSTRLTCGGNYVEASLRATNDDHPLMRWLNDSRVKGFIQHEARGHMASDLARYFFCSVFAREVGRSPKLQDWPGSLKPAHRNVEQKKNGELEATGFSDRFKVQGVGNAPSSTITSHIAKDGHYYIHYDPTQCRSLTVREAARLQTFKDNYFFCGNRTQQYHQVGNAVPPFLAKQIADRVSSFLANSLFKKPSEASKKRGLISNLTPPNNKKLPAGAA